MPSPCFIRAPAECQRCRGNNGDQEPDCTEHLPSAAEDSRPKQTDSSPPRPPRSRLIDRYAASKQFHWDAARERYCHSNGSSILKCTGGFNWELYSSAGHPVRRLWVTEQSLSNGGVEIASDLWELIRNSSSRSALIVEGETGQAVELSGDELEKWIATGAVTGFPAKASII